MKIGVIQATSQKDKNELLYRCTAIAVNQSGHEAINFGCIADEPVSFSYIEIAVAVSMLLASAAIDFVVTGCSSGRGMMLACNSLPDVICGYAENPQDALLLKRLNALTKRNAVDVYEQLDDALIKKVLQKKNVTEYILEYGSNRDIPTFIQKKL